MFFVCPVISLTSCLAVMNYIGNLCQFLLYFCMYLEVSWANQIQDFSNSRNGWGILNLYLVIIMSLHILRTNKLIKGFCLVLVRYIQLSLDQSNPKILEIPITQEKLLNPCMYGKRRPMVSQLSVCQLVNRSVGKPVFFKTGFRIFLKHIIKLECFKGRVLIIKLDCHYWGNSSPTQC